eukprot:jgi/Mesvir1/14256/Mv09692-RA.1
MRHRNLGSGSTRRDRCCSRIPSARRLLLLGLVFCASLTLLRSFDVSKLLSREKFQNTDGDNQAAAHITAARKSRHSNVKKHHRRHRCNQRVKVTSLTGIAALAVAENEWSEEEGEICIDDVMRDDAWILSYPKPTQLLGPSIARILEKPGSSPPPEAASSAPPLNNNAVPNSNTALPMGSNDSSLASLALDGNGTSTATAPPPVAPQTKSGRHGSKHGSSKSNSGSGSSSSPPVSVDSSDGLPEFVEFFDYDEDADEEGGEEDVVSSVAVAMEMALRARNADLSGIAQAAAVSASGGNDSVTSSSAPVDVFISKATWHNVKKATSFRPTHEDRAAASRAFAALAQLPKPSFPPGETGPAGPHWSTLLGAKAGAGGSSGGKKTGGKGGLLAFAKIIGGGGQEEEEESPVPPEGDSPREDYFSQPTSELLEKLEGSGYPHLFAPFLVQANVTAINLPSLSDLRAAPREQVVAVLELLASGEFRANVTKRVTPVFAYGDKYLPVSSHEAERPWEGLSCAAVGNSGSLVRSGFGPAIDSHDIVARINQGPMAGYDADVGRAVGMRLMNHKWAKDYRTKEHLRLEAGVIATLSRVDAREFMQFAIDTERRRRKLHIQLRLLSSRFVSLVTRALREFRAAVAAGGGGLYPGGRVPSSGAVLVCMLMRLCSKVTVYGIGGHPSHPWGLRPGHVWRYHYFSGTDDAHYKEAHYHHSFSLERDFLWALDAAGHIELCHPFRNATCGMKTQSGFIRT